MQCCHELSKGIKIKEASPAVKSGQLIAWRSVFQNMFGRVYKLVQVALLQLMFEFLVDTCSTIFCLLRSNFKMLYESPGGNQVDGLPPA